MTGPAEPTAAAAEAIVAPSPPATVRAAGDSGRKIRRTVAYALLIGYAFLMVIPFLWQLITSFKTNPDAAAPDRHPQPVHAAGLADRLPDARPEHPPALPEQRHHRRRRDADEPRPREHRRLRVRPAPLPAPRALFIAVLGTLMIPDQLRFVPVYLIERQLGLITRNPVNYSAWS